MEQRRGRPKLAPGEKSILVGVKWPAGQLQRLDATAKAMAMSRSEMVRNWLELLVSEQEEGNANAKPVQIELFPV